MWDNTLNGKGDFLGAYKYIRETCQKEIRERPDEYKRRITAWRKEPTMVRVDRPTNLSRARTLGYKAKTGYVIVRVKVRKGRRKRPKPDLGRKPGHNYKFVQPRASHQAKAEQKADKRYVNLEVLNSYLVGEDGNCKFFEVILIDANSPAVKVKVGKRRAARGLTSAGKKARGLRAKGRRKKRIRNK